MQKYTVTNQEQMLKVLTYVICLEQQLQTCLLSCG